MTRLRVNRGDAMGGSKLHGLMMHVGADSTNLGISGPVFDDTTFEFVPIYESLSRLGSESLETRTYHDLASTNSRKSIASYVPQKFLQAVPHCDPDLENFTYSDPQGGPRGKQLQNLQPADYLFFVASLAPYCSGIRQSQKGLMAKYLVGYFRIQGIYNITKHNDKHAIRPLNESPINSDVKRRIFKNPHFKRLRDSFVCCVGFRDRQTLLLRKAFRLTEKGSPFRPNSFGRSLYGDVGFPRGFKWLAEQQVHALLSEIRKA